MTKVKNPWFSVPFGKVDGFRVSAYVPLLGFDERCTASDFFDQPWAPPRLSSTPFTCLRVRAHEGIVMSDLLCLTVGYYLPFPGGRPFVLGGPFDGHFYNFCVGCTKLLAPEIRALALLEEVATRLCSDVWKIDNHPLCKEGGCTREPNLRIDNRSVCWRHAAPSLHRRLLEEESNFKERRTSPLRQIDDFIRNFERYVFEAWPEVRPQEKKLHHVHQEDYFDRPGGLIGAVVDAARTQLEDPISSDWFYRQRMDLRRISSSPLYVSPEASEVAALRADLHQSQERFRELLRASETIEEKE